MNENSETGARIAVLERSLSDLATNLNSFVDAQKDENNRLYSALGSMGDRFTASLDTLKEALGARGRITGQFVLTLLATALSFAALTGGAVHFYVSNQIGLAKGEMVGLQNQVLSLKSEVDKNAVLAQGSINALTTQLTAEHDRALVADTTSATERKIMFEELRQNQKELRENKEDELRRLRDLRDNAVLPRK